MCQIVIAIAIATSDNGILGGMECSTQTAIFHDVVMATHLYSPWAMHFRWKGKTMKRAPSLFFQAIIGSAAIILGSIANPFCSVASANETAKELAKPDADKAPGLGDPGKLVSIAIIAGQSKNGDFTLAGRDAAQQIMVFGKYDSGQTRDLSRQAKYTTEPQGIFSIDSSGYSEPVKEGVAKLKVEAHGFTATSNVTVSNIQNDLPVNFANQIVPVFTKFGCNGGGCHGKSGGQNGFRLSLLGFEPTEDFEYLLKEGRGRRIFPAAPDKSLLLTKAVGKSPHGGGARFTEGSPPYRLIKRWIEQGMPYGNESDPKVVRIQVEPRGMLMQRKESQQVSVIAHFSDGSTKDVTRTTQFDSNDTEMAEVTETGLVTTSTYTGSVAVMARYQGHVDVFRATIPLGIQVKSLPAEKNFIDKHVFANLKSLGLPPSQLSDDSTFLRRVTIDIAGRLPSADETAVFLGDSSADKRDKLIRRLLDSNDYADNFANKWSAILRNKRSRNEDKYATFAFHDWIRTSFLENKRYDQFVREIVTANGVADQNPPSAWYREVKDQAAQVEDTAQLFLGLRIQCARCHHHPFEKWSQEDYYGFAAFFAQVGKKRGMRNGESRIYQRQVAAVAQNPKTQKNVAARGLGAQAEPIDPSQDARRVLADWMAKKDNPFFAKSLVNRYWKHFFSRGLVDPEDDMRVTNPSSNPELLDALARDFVESDFNLKELIYKICSSNTYQFSAIPNQWNAKDKNNFSRYYPKRLNAEVLLDSINQVTSTSTSFSGMPAGTRAIQLPDNGFNSYFLTVFGRPESSSACECERSGEANLAQSLHLLNSSEIQGKLTDGKGRASTLAGDKSRDDVTRLTELYIAAFSRKPIPEELQIATSHIKKHEKDPKRAYEDIVWALINTKEFLFNH